MPSDCLVTHGVDCCSAFLRQFLLQTRLAILSNMSLDNPSASSVFVGRIEVDKLETEIACSSQYSERNTNLPRVV
jgi:hypothetical protein